jgi:hypothetical protein
VEGFEFVADIKDASSGPSKDVIAALDGLTAALDRNEAAFKRNESAHKGLANGLSEAGKKARESEGFFASFGASLVPQIALGELAAEGIRKVGESIVEGGKFALEASEFRENTTLAYETVLGTAEEGEKTYAEIDKIARINHLPGEKAQGLASELMLQGLQNQKELTDTVAAVGALQRTGQEQGAARLQKIIESSLVTEKFNVNAKQLRGTGIQIDELYRDIGDRLHVGQSQVKALMKAGKVDVDVGVAALDDAVNKGNIGKLAAKKYGVPDALVDIKNNLRGLFQNTDASPITNSLKGLAEQLKEGSEGGKELQATIGSLIDLTGTLVSAGGGLAGAFADAFKGIEHLAEGAIDKLHDLTRPARGSYDDAADKDVNDRIHKELMAAKERADIDDLIAQNKGDAKPFAGASPDLNSPIEKARAEALERGKALGEGISTGIAEGIRSGKPTVDAAVIDVTGGVITRGRKELDSHSPSRKTMAMGEDAAEGFKIGLEGGSGKASNAMSFDVEPPKLLASASSGTSGRPIIYMGGQTYQLSGVDKPEEFAQIVVEQMVDLLEQAGLEVGQ